MKIAILWILLAAYCYIGCTSAQEKDIKSYYFPTAHLRSGTVYEYVPTGVGSDALAEYWYYITVPTDTANYFVGTYYDPNFEVKQLTRELIDASGALTQSLIVYETDTATHKSKPVEATVKHGNTFPFHVRDTVGVYLYEVKYQLPNDANSTIYLIRNRRYGGAGEPLLWHGKKYATIKMNLLEAVGNSAEGNAEMRGSGTEWYAEGLGLVRYQKKYGSGTHTIALDFSLRDTFSMTLLEQRASKKQ